MWIADRWVAWGAVLVAVGVIVLLSDLGVLPEATLDVLWPLLLIALGVWLLFQGRPAKREDVVTAFPGEGRARTWVAVRRRFPMAAAVFIALGFAFLLDDLVGPGSTLPLVLMALGIVFLIRGRVAREPA